MTQMGFFDAACRLSALSDKGDPLVRISTLVPWESFRADIEAVALTPNGSRKSTAGRKPIDALFRMLVLQSLYNLSDEQVDVRFVTGSGSHAFSAWAWRYCGRHHVVAVPREAGEGGSAGDVVQAIWPAPRGQGLYRTRRPDGRRDDC